MKRFGLVGLVALSALAFAACDDGGSDGGEGGDRNGDGTGAGANGDDESCTVEDNGDGTATISCPDGTEVDVSTTPADEIEQCSVEDNGDGTATISCPDGSSVTTAVGGIGGEAVRFIQHYSDITLYTARGTQLTTARVNRARNGLDSVASYQVSADNTKLLYLADHDTDGVNELYLVDISGSSPSAAVKLNGALVAGGDVSSAIFSPDGNWVAYLADQAVDDVFEAYVVDISGGEPADPIKVNGALLATGDVQSFRFSPDSNLLAVLQDRTNEAVNELYLVDLSAPGAGVRVNPALVATRSVEADYTFSANSENLYYRADQLSADVIELFVSDVSSGAPETPVEVSAISTGTVGSYYLSPDGGSIVYQDSNDADLYLVGSGDLGTATVLYSTANSPTVSVAGARFSGDSGLFLFLGTDVADATGVTRLVAVEVDGADPGDVLDLSGDVVDDGAATSFTLNFTGDRLVFLGTDINSYASLYFVNLGDIGAPQRVHPALSAGYAGDPVWAEAADVVTFSLPNAPYGYRGTASVDLSGDEPGELRNILASQYDWHYVRTSSENGRYLYAGGDYYAISPPTLLDTTTGTSLVIPGLYYYYPIEWVNPLD